MQQEIKDCIGYIAWILCNTVLFFAMFKLFMKEPTRDERLRKVLDKYRKPLLQVH